MIKLFLTVIPYLNFCETIISEAFNVTPKEEQVLVCTMLLSETRNFPKLKKELVLAVSWEETRLFMKSTPNYSNCAGPLQIKIKYWCPNSADAWSIHSNDGLLSNCDLIYRGLFALNYYIKKPNSLPEKICFYGPAKNCTNWKKEKYSRRYVKSVLTNLKNIKKAFKHMETPQ